MSEITQKDFQVIKNIETRVATICLRSDSIISLRFKSNSIVLPEDQYIHKDIFIELSGGTKKPILFSANHNVTITKEARETAEKIESQTPILALGLIADSLPLKLISDFYLKFHKPQVPYKVFTNQDQATKWLRAFLTPSS